MTEPTLNNIKNLIEDYKIFSKNLEGDKYRHYANLFDGFIGGYQTLTDILAYHEAHFAEQYNIFSILNIRHREVKTHTPFLKNLLDIRGEHAQNELFYHKFIDTVFEESDDRKSVFRNISKHHLEVIEELPTVFGRIDIFIRHFSNDNPFCICIENKIYAPDQPKQLERYYNYMRNTIGMKEDQVLLIYLSPDGKVPIDYTINEKLRIELKDKGILKNISYRKEINDWLTSCKQEVKASPIHSILNQYIKIIVAL